MGRPASRAAKRRDCKYNRHRISSVTRRAERDAETKKTLLKIGFLNVDHLTTPTFVDVVSTVETQALDVVFLFETYRTVEDSHEDISLANYAKYETLRSEVSEDKKGGGIAAFCKISEGLNVSRIKMEIDMVEEQFVEKERLWVEVKNDHGRKTAVCGVYMGCETPDDRHGVWNDLMFSRLQKEVIELRAKGYRVVLVGDFNAWIGNNMSSGGIPGNREEINNNGRKFLAFLSTVEMVHVNGATRTPGDWSTRLTSGLWTRQRGSSSSILDYAVVGKECLDSVESLMVEKTGSGSDHNWMFLAIKESFKIQKRVVAQGVKMKIWDIKEDQSWTGFTQVVTDSLADVDQSSVVSLGRGLSGALLAALRSEIGLKQVSSNVRRKTLPGGIVQEIKLKKEYEASFKHALTEYLAGNEVSEESVNKKEVLYNKQKVKVQQLCSLFKSMKRRRTALACEGDGKAARKKFWGFVSNKEEKSSEIWALIHPESGVLKCDPDEVKCIAENFLKDLFKGSFEPIPPKVQERQEERVLVKSSEGESCVQDHQYCKPGGFPGSKRIPAPPPSVEHGYARNPSPKLVSTDNSCSVDTDPAGFCDGEIKKEEVEAAIKLLKPSKAVGWGNIPNEAIKNAGIPFVLLLTVLFNMIKIEGVLPVGWNRGRMVLIHKRGAIENIMNYRPLTVVISLCGVLSRVLNARLIEAVESTNMLGEIQNGFRRTRCCADNNFVLSTILWKARAMGKKVYCAYIDLFKA